MSARPPRARRYENFQQTLAFLTNAEAGAHDREAGYGALRACAAAARPDAAVAAVRRAEGDHGAVLGPRAVLAVACAFAAARETPAALVGLPITAALPAARLSAAPLAPSARDARLRPPEPCLLPGCAATPDDPYSDAHLEQLLGGIPRRPELRQWEEVLRAWRAACMTGHVVLVSLYKGRVGLTLTRKSVRQSLPHSYQRNIWSSTP